MAIERLPLTISQKWLIIEMEKFKHRGWATMEYFARTKAVINVPAMREAVYFLMDKYENLRVKIFREAGQWVQEVYPLSEADPFAEYDFSEMDNERRKREMRRVCIRERDALLPETGNLIRVLFFKMAENKGRIWFCIHHLLADHVAASLLIRECTEVYKDVAAGKELKWETPKEYRKWLYALEGYCRDILLPAELGYWETLPWERMGIVPSDFPEKYDNEQVIADGFVNKTNLEGYKPAFYHLPTEELMALFKIVGGEFEDLLTAIFFLAVAKVKQMDWIGVGVSNSGRSVLPPDYGIDKEKLMGYLSVYRMLLLNKPSKDDLAVELEDIMDQIRAVPGRGVGISFVKEQLQNVHLRKSYFNFQQRGVIYLNYVGRTEMTPGDADLFEPLYEDTGVNIHLDEWQYNLLTCKVGIVRNQLAIGISYNEDYFMAETIDDILDSMKAMFKELALAKQSAKLLQ